MAKKQEFYDVVVIGGGPGGLTAAIYCGRARLKTLLLEKSLLGGLVTYTSEIENYPGFPEGESGLGLMKRFEQQAKRFNVDIKLTDAKELRVEGDYRVVSTFRTDYYAKAVIISTGGKPRLTGAQNEGSFLFDKGISFCATCDAARYTDKEVMVIGSGDAAIEEALFLTKFASKVHVSVLHDVGIMDANKVAQEKAMRNPKMEFHWNTIVQSFEGEEQLQTVVLKQAKTGELIPVSVDGCFLFIGYVPNTELFEDLLDLNRQGYIRTNELMETKMDGVFAVGDVREKFLRQVATAVGDGAIAGVMAEKYVEESEYFCDKIMQPEKLVLAFVYNAAESRDRGLLAKAEAVQKILGDEITLCCIDTYKSDRLACRLGCTQTPALVFINGGTVVGTEYDVENLSLDLATLRSRWVK